MDDLVACEIDGINPLEPNNINLEYARAHYPKLVLWGGIDDKELLSFETPRRLRKR